MKVTLANSSSNTVPTKQLVLNLKLTKHPVLTYTMTWVLA